MNQATVPSTVLGGLDDQKTIRMVAKALSSPPYGSCTDQPVTPYPLVLDLSSTSKNESSNTSELLNKINEKPLLTIRSGLFINESKQNCLKGQSFQNAAKLNQINKSDMASASTAVAQGTINVASEASTNLLPIDGFTTGCASVNRFSPSNKASRIVTAQATIVPPLATAIQETTSTTKGSDDSQSPSSSHSSLHKSVKISGKYASDQSPKHASKSSSPTENHSSFSNGTPPKYKSPSVSPATSPNIAGSEVKGMLANPQPVKKTSQSLSSSLVEKDTSIDGGRLTIFNGGKLLLELSHRTTKAIEKDSCWVQVKSSKTYWPPSSSLSSSPSNPFLGHIKRESRSPFSKSNHRKRRKPSRWNSNMLFNSPFMFKQSKSSKKLKKKSKRRRNPFLNINLASVHSFILGWTRSSSSNKKKRDRNSKKDNIENKINNLYNRKGISLNNHFKPNSKFQSGSHFASPKKRYLKHSEPEEISHRKKSLQDLISNSHSSNPYNIQKRIFSKENGENFASNTSGSSFNIDYLLNNERRNEHGPCKSMYRPCSSPVKRNECDVIKHEGEYLREHHNDQLKVKQTPHDAGRYPVYEDRSHVSSAQHSSVPSPQHPPPPPATSADAGAPLGYPPHMYNPLYDPNYLLHGGIGSQMPLAVAAAAAAAAAASISSISSYGLQFSALPALAATQYSNILNSFNPAALAPALAAAAANNPSLVANLAAGLPASALTPALTPGATPQPSGSAAPLNPPPATLTPGMSPQPSSYSSLPKHTPPQHLHYQKNYQSHEYKDPYHSLKERPKQGSRDYASPYSSEHYSSRDTEDHCKTTHANHDYYHQRTGSSPRCRSPMGPPHPSINPAHSMVSSPWKNHKNSYLPNRHHSTYKQPYNDSIGDRLCGTVESIIQDMPLNLSKPRPD